MADTATEPQVEGNMIVLTEKEMREKIDGDRAFREDYLKNPDRYQIKEEGAVPQGGPPAAPQGGPAASSASTPVVEDELIQVTAKIPKSALEYYSQNGRTPEEAMAELAKGLKEKDQYIEFLKTRVKESTDQATSLRAEFKAHQKKQTVQPPAVPDEIQVSTEAPFNVDELPEDETIFEPDNVKKMASGLKFLVKQNQELAKALKSHNDAIKAVRTSNAQDEIEQAQTAAVAAEYDSIRDMQAQFGLGTKVAFNALDDEVELFYQNLAREQGVSDPLNFQARVPAINAYFAQTPEAEQLRKQLQSKGIAPPAEFDRHQAIMRVRAERENHRARLTKSLSTKFGRDVQPWEVEDMLPSFSDLAPKVLGPRGPTAEDLVRARIEGAQAAAARPTTPVAAEVPPHMGVPALTADGLSADAAMALLSKDSSLYTQEEAQVVYELLKKLDAPIPDNVSNRIKKPGG